MHDECYLQITGHTQLRSWKLKDSFSITSSSASLVMSVDKVLLWSQISTSSVSSTVQRFLSLEHHQATSVVQAECLAHFGRKLRSCTRHDFVSDNDHHWMSSDLRNSFRNHAEGSIVTLNDRALYPVRVISNYPVVGSEVYRCLYLNVYVDNVMVMCSQINYSSLQIECLIWLSASSRVTVRSQLGTAVTSDMIDMIVMMPPGKHCNQ